MIIPVPITKKEVAPACNEYTIPVEMGYRCVTESQYNNYVSQERQEWQDAFVGAGIMLAIIVPIILILSIWAAKKWPWGAQVTPTTSAAFLPEKWTKDV